MVGLVPLKALLEAAEYYIKRDRLFVVNEGDKIRLVRGLLFVCVSECMSARLCFSILAFLAEFI